MWGHTVWDLAVLVWIQLRLWIQLSCVLGGVTGCRGFAASVALHKIGLAEAGQVETGRREQACLWIDQNIFANTAALN
jgi:hypothetical protein